MRTNKKFILLISVLLMSQAHTFGQVHHENHKELKSDQVQSSSSIYHLKDTWIDHRNEPLELIDLKGKPVIIVMFYGNCTTVCPILIRDAKRLHQAVDSDLRKKVKVLAITFDPENDTPDVLRKYVIKKELDNPQWHFLTGDASSIRTLATLLGVKYSKKCNGHFSHSNLVTVLDLEGNILDRIEGLNQPIDQAAKKIERLFTQPPLKASH